MKTIRILVLASICSLPLVVGGCADLVSVGKCIVYSPRCN